MTYRPFFALVIALTSSCSVIRPDEQGFYFLGVENGKERYRMMGGYYGLSGSTYESKYVALDELLDAKLRTGGHCGQGYKIVLHTTSEGGGNLIADALCN